MGARWEEQNIGVTCNEIYSHWRVETGFFNLDENTLKDTVKSLLRLVCVMYKDLFNFLQGNL